MSRDRRTGVQPGALHRSRNGWLRRYLVVGLCPGKGPLTPRKETDLLAWVRFIRILPLGASGANSVEGGSERRAALLGCPLPRRGRAPAPKASEGHWHWHWRYEDVSRILFLSGVNPY
jgi:hypothetical protein